MILSLPLSCQLNPLLDPLHSPLLVPVLPCPLPPSQASTYSPPMPCWTVPLPPLLHRITSNWNSENQQETTCSHRSTRPLTSFQERQVYCCYRMQPRPAWIVLATLKWQKGRRTWKNKMNYNCLCAAPTS